MVTEEFDDESEQELLAPAQLMDSGTLATIQKAEIDQQIATAKKYPRAITKLLTTATQLVTADGETADECIFALPRGGKVIEGPSVRFAEVMAYSWGNSRCGARVIGEDEEFVTAMGTFFDLEANVAIAYEVKRRITNKKGERFNSDMIGTTSNAACSIALRNAILRGIPKAIWRKVYAEARKAVAGDIKTLDARRQAAIKQFQLQGVKPEQVFAKLGVKGIEDIMLDHLVTLRGIYNAIRENEITAERAFAPESTEDTKLADKSKSNVATIKEKYAEATGIEIGPLRSAPKRQKKAVEEKIEAVQAEAASQAQETPSAPAPEVQEGAHPPASGKEPDSAGAQPGSAPEAKDETKGVPLNFE
jgi:hypothetical protein